MSSIIDLDALAGRREVEEPDGITIKFRGEEFTVPAELPADVLVPFMNPDLDLMGLVKLAMADRANNESVVDALLDRKDLFPLVQDTLVETLELLFGEDQFGRFVTLRPSIPDYLRLVKGLTSQYGVSLGEAFGSFTSSSSDGETSKENSPAPIGEWTPDGPGAVGEPETVLSASAGSAT